MQAAAAAAMAAMAVAMVVVRATATALLVAVGLDGLGMAAGMPVVDIFGVVALMARRTSAIAMVSVHDAQQQPWLSLRGWYQHRVALRREDSTAALTPPVLAS